MLKQVNIRFWIYAVVLAAAVSCAREPGVGSGDKKAVLEISASSSLDGVAGDPDIAVTSLRVMVFRRSSYILHNFKIDLTKGQPFTVELDRGDYDFVFIANEDSDESLRGGQTLTQILDDYAGLNTDRIFQEYFSSSAIRSDYSIPMTKIFRNVSVRGDNLVSGDAVQMVGNTWAVEVERTGVRVDLFLQTSDQAIADRFESLSVLNVPGKVYMFPTDATGQPMYNVTGASDFEPTLASYRRWAGDEGDAYAADADEDVGYTLTATYPGLSFAPGAGGKWYWYKRIILPETVFADSGDKSKGVVLRVTALGKTYSVTLDNGNVATPDHTLGRNMRYRVNGTLSWEGIDFSTTVSPWSSVGNEVILDGQYYLKTSQSKFIFNSVGGLADATFTTNYDGLTGKQAGLDFDTSGTDSWCTVTLAGESAVDGIYAKTFRIETHPYSDPQNPEQTARRTSFKVTAGNLTYVVGIRQNRFEDLTWASVWSEDDSQNTGRKILHIDSRLPWRISDVTVTEPQTATSPSDVMIYSGDWVGKTGEGTQSLYYYFLGSAPVGTTVRVTVQDLNGVNADVVFDLVKQ